MPPLTAPADDLRALDEGRAAIDLSDHRVVRVRGGDARGWLHDLVTTDVASLEPGGARRSLLLDPTGHIRADVQVACDDDGFWLFQAPDQPDHIAAMLFPYVLSADVRIEDLSEDRALVALPGPVSNEGADRGHSRGSAPSIVGDGRDLLLPAGPIVAPPGRVLVDPAAFEVWRIRRGRARMGVDFDRSSIPAEVGLESTIDATKGCFLGQESVARVRNLGHPPRVLRHLRGDGHLERGSTILTIDDGDAGVVTSAAEAEDGEGTVVLASIRWPARESPLRSPDGVALVPVGSSD